MGHTLTVELTTSLGNNYSNLQTLYPVGIQKYSDYHQVLAKAGLPKLVSFPLQPWGVAAGLSEQSLQVLHALVRHVNSQGGNVDYPMVSSVVDFWCLSFADFLVFVDFLLIFDG